VLSCNAIASEPLLAYVSFSTPSYATDTILESFAPTLLLEKDGQPIETLKPVKGTFKYWKSTVKLEEGVAYSITVSAPNFPTISASTIIPAATRLKPFLIDSNTFSYNQLNLDTTVLRVPLMIRPDKLAESDSIFAFRLKYQIVSPNLNESEQKATFVANGPIFVNLHESPDGTFLVNKNLWRSNMTTHLFSSHGNRLSVNNR
jgi:hypothetical protein